MPKLVVVSAVAMVFLALGAGVALADDARIQCRSVPCYASGDDDLVLERKGNGKQDEIILRGVATSSAPTATPTIRTWWKAGWVTTRSTTTTATRATRRTGGRATATLATWTPGRKRVGGAARLSSGRLAAGERPRPGGYLGLGGAPTRQAALKNSSLSDEPTVLLLG
jgi:hypothetical protein